MLSIAQGGGGVTIPESLQETCEYAFEDRVNGEHGGGTRLDLMILKSFSNFSNFMIL